MRRLAAVAVAAACLALAPAASAADALLPPRGKVFSGLTGGLSVDLFERQTGNHPAVFGFFTRFSGANEFIFRSAEQAGSRLMLHISTQNGYGTPEFVAARDRPGRRRPLPREPQPARSPSTGSRRTSG